MPHSKTCHVGSLYVQRRGHPGSWEGWSARLLGARDSRADTRTASVSVGFRGRAVSVYDRGAMYRRHPLHWSARLLLRSGDRAKEQTGDPENSQGAEVQSSPRIGQVTDPRRWGEGSVLREAARPRLMTTIRREASFMLQGARKATLQGMVAKDSDDGT